MSLYLADSADLTSVANAIRTKGGTSGQLAFPQGFVDAIGNISGGGDSSAVSGTVTPIERQKTWRFSAPGCTFFFIYAETEPDKTTGQGYIVLVGGENSGRWNGVVSNNGGTSNINATSAHVDLTYSNGEFVLTSGASASTATTRCLQPGITYIWAAM